jgi:hypothetical protein
MKPELVRFTDGIHIIVGAHLSLEEAREQFGREYDTEMDAFDDDKKIPIISVIESVKHWWVRYEFIGSDNCPDDFDPEPDDRCWMLKEQEKRPKGVVRKATVINV